MAISINDVPFSSGEVEKFKVLIEYLNTLGGGGDNLELTSRVEALEGLVSRVEALETASEA